MYVFSSFNFSDRYSNILVEDNLVQSEERHREIHVRIACALGTQRAVQGMTKRKGYSRSVGAANCFSLGKILYWVVYDVDIFEDEKI